MEIDYKFLFLKQFNIVFIFARLGLKPAESFIIFSNNLAAKFLEINHFLNKVKFPKTLLNYYFNDFEIFI